MNRIKNNTAGTNPLKGEKHRNEPDRTNRASSYNYNSMDNEQIAVRTGFADNMARLRIKKGISAREMSLSLGQSASYINDIENGRTLPSMGMFFEICEYLKITPFEFFSYADTGKSDFEHEISSAKDRLSEEDQALLLSIARRMLK